MSKEKMPRAEKAMKIAKEIMNQNDMLRDKMGTVDEYKAKKPEIVIPILEDFLDKTRSKIDEIKSLANESSDLEKEYCNKILRSVSELYSGVEEVLIDALSSKLTNLFAEIKTKISS